MWLRSLGLYFILTLAPGGAGDAAAVKCGEALLGKYCSRCHAIADTGEKSAPASSAISHFGKALPR
jgi:mono/diheme cytochrome c family protein